MSEIILKPRGTIDYMKEDKILLDAVYDFLDEYAYRYGAKKIDVPMFEEGKLFIRGVGESTDIVNKEMFRLDVKGEHDYILRPEFTAPINRSVVENKMYASPDLPLKFTYHGPVFRFERPQAGRYRQFNQFGVEFFDKNIDLSTQLDALLLFYNAAKNLIKHDLILKINYLGNFETRENYKVALKEFYKDKIDDMCEDCKRRYETNTLRILDCKDEHDIEINKSAPALSDYIVGEEKEKFDAILRVLDELHIPYVIDSMLVRGLDYYTGLVFEVYDKTAMQLGAIGGGGQYDKLMKEIGNIDFEGIGFSYGVERLLLSLDEDRRQELLSKYNTYNDVFIVDVRKERSIDSIVIANKLRDEGLRVNTASYSKALNGSLKMADRERSKYALIFDDKNEGFVNLKNMQERTQVSIALGDVDKVTEEILKNIRG